MALHSLRLQDVAELEQVIRNLLRMNSRFCDDGESSPTDLALVPKSMSAMDESVLPKSLSPSHLRPPPRPKCPVHANHLPCLLLHPTNPSRAACRVVAAVPQSWTFSHSSHNIGNSVVRSLLAANRPQPNAGRTCLLHDADSTGPRVRCE